MKVIDYNGLISALDGIAVRNVQEDYAEIFEELFDYIKDAIIENTMEVEVK